MAGGASTSWATRASQAGGQADVEVDPQGPGHQAAKAAAQGGPGGPAHHLAQQQAEGDPVVAVGRPRLPGRGGGGEGGGHGVEVVPPGGVFHHGLVAGEVDHPRGVGEDLAQGDAALAVGGELRPVGGHGALEVDGPALGQGLDGEGGGPFGGGEDHRHGVGLPGDAGPGLAAPQIGDQTVLHEGGESGAHLAPFHEVGGEGVGHRFEPGGHRPRGATVMGWGRALRRRRPTRRRDGCSPRRRCPRPLRRGCARSARGRRPVRRSGGAGPGSR